MEFFFDVFLLDLLGGEWAGECFVDFDSCFGAERSDDLFYEDCFCGLACSVDGGLYAGRG